MQEAQKVTNGKHRARKLERGSNWMLWLEGMGEPVTLRGFHLRDSKKRKVMNRKTYTIEQPNNARHKQSSPPD